MEKVTLVYMGEQLFHSGHATDFNSMFHLTGFLYATTLFKLLAVVCARTILKATMLVEVLLCRKQKNVGWFSWITSSNTQTGDHQFQLLHSTQHTNQHVIYYIYSSSIVVLVVQQFGVGLVIKRSLVWLLTGVLSSLLGQLSLPSRQGR